MTTSPTRYLCGYPIWFELRDVSASSSNLDKSASSDEILTKNDEKLTMKRIVDHMKRNHVAYAKLNVRTSPESIESVRFITFTYQPYQTYTYIQIRNIIATEKNYERFVDLGRGVAIAIGNEDLSSIRIVKEPSDLECFESTKVKICVLSISSRGQKGRAPKCIKGHEMRFILPQRPSSYRNAGAWRCDDCLRVFNDPERPDFCVDASTSFRVYKMLLESMYRLCRGTANRR